MPTAASTTQCYDAETVRAAVLAADARKHERRSRAAKKAAQTRGQHRQRRIQCIAKQAAARNQTGQRQRCCVCGKRLSERTSRRGIGSECWQDVLREVEALLQPAG